MAPCTGADLAYYVHTELARHKHTIELVPVDKDDEKKPGTWVPILNTYSHWCAHPPRATVASPRTSS